MQLLALVLSLLLTSPQYTVLYNDVVSRQGTITEPELESIYSYIIGDDTE
jgi:hypothetical protein